MFKKFLTTPERSKWVLSEKKSGKCIFCEIVKGNEKIPEMKIYENDFAMVLMNMYPYNSGHIMVVPKKHNENLEDLNDEELSEQDNRIDEHGQYHQAYLGGFQDREKINQASEKIPKGRGIQFRGQHRGKGRGRLDQTSACSHSSEV